MPTLTHNNPVTVGVIQRPDEPVVSIGSESEETVEVVIGENNGPTIAQVESMVDEMLDEHVINEHSDVGDLAGLFLSA